ncbi:MAG TPA: sulfite exporter TauE/SafE family protein, partial [Dictyoglomaceae bacterium]|nr:sulfite exporter TauE/SafE family protein [Dictyoglomaceae bacterium]
AIGSIVGAQIGSLLSSHTSATNLSNAFSIFLLITAVIFWFRGIKSNMPDFNYNRAASQQSGILRFLRSNVIISGLLLGFLVGIISGLLGAGGGVMILLILVFVMQYNMHEGIGTSTLIMAFTAASGAIGHALSSNLPFKAAIFGAIGTIIGGRFAAKFANKVNETVLSKIVGGVFAALAIMMFIVQ